MRKLRLVPRGSFRDDRRGIAALEYGLLASIVSAAFIGSLIQYETAVQSLFGGFNLAITQISSSLGPGVAGTGAGTGTGGGSGSSGGDRNGEDGSSSGGDNSHPHG